jgi:hypothetical protein
VAWPRLGICGSKAGRHKHNKGRKLQPLKCSRFHLGKTSNRWWACHGGAIEQASKVTSVQREHAQHEGWRHRHASEGINGVGLDGGLTNGLVDMKVILSNTSKAAKVTGLWHRVPALRMSTSNMVAALVRLEIVMASCLVKRKKHDISWWFGHKIEQVAGTGRQGCNLGR